MTLILMESWPFKLSYLGQLSCTVEYGFCVIDSFHELIYMCWGHNTDVHVAF